MSGAVLNTQSVFKGNFNDGVYNGYQAPESNSIPSIDWLLVCLPLMHPNLKPISSKVDSSTNRLP